MNSMRLISNPDASTLTNASPKTAKSGSRTPIGDGLMGNRAEDEPFWEEGMLP
jgi:hypothetical protein